MCGIAGFIGSGDSETLIRMGETLVHRGPDNKGIHYDPGRVGFYFRRLAIIDVTTGNQPVKSADGRIVCIFNGEIYNYRELKSRFLSQVNFMTNGDAEVLPHLYERFGTEMFSHLNGMFAIALWDAQNETLVLARDRFGKKPLYYARTGKGVVFGSEIKALLRHPDIKKSLDPAALSLYLNHEYVPGSYSLFTGIRKLMPGHYGIFTRGEWCEREYYRPRFSKPGATVNLPVAITGLEVALDTAVRERLISDVPLGAFLSGGLDSSTVCYYASRHLTRPLQTFAIGFKEKSFDESGYALRVARHLGTDHHEHTVSGRDLIASIPKVTDLLDEPTGDPALFSNYLLSRFARAHVTVVLGGDGGDELFMGYPTFQAHQAAAWYEKIPAVIRARLIDPVIRRLPTSFGYLPLDYKLKRFVSGLAFPPNRRDLVWIGAFNPDERDSVMTAEVTAHALEYFTVADRVDAEVADEPLLNRVAYQYLKTYLIDDVICLKDRASMFNSLELRAPFLDYHVVDLANSLPPEMKLNGFTTKFILKKLMEKRLPRDIVYRAKQGFGVPIAEWLRGELRELATDLLGEDRIRHQKLFRPEFVTRLLADHLKGVRDNRKQLWTLLMFQMWYDKWLA